MERCPDLYRLAAYQEHLLSAKEQTAVREHIAACARCAHEVQRLHQTAQLLNAMPKPSMPADLWQGVAAQLPVRNSRQIYWRYAAGFAMAASLIAGLLVTRFDHASLPITTGQSAYVTQHALLSAQDPLADRAALGVALTVQEDHK